MDNFLPRLLLLVAIPMLFAYLELGGNWFAYRLLEKPGLWAAAGTIVFSILYSIISAAIAHAIQVDFTLLMVSYGFGFSIVAILFRLDWGQMPTLTSEYLIRYPYLGLLLGIALIGFVLGNVLVIFSRNE